MCEADQKTLDVMEKMADKGNPDNPLQQSYKKQNEYFQGFLKIARLYLSVMNEKEFNKWLQEKMGIGNAEMSIAQYIQFACEATVVAHFINTQRKTIEIDKQVNPSNKKDVECQFQDSDFTYNIEVKTPDIDLNKPKEDNDLNLYVSGRLPDIKEIDSLKSILSEGLRSQNKEGNIGQHKNLDNNLVTYLKGLHEKSNPIERDDIVNVLVVCGGDRMNMQSLYDNLFANEGLFTKSPFTPPETYTLVDIIMFTNLHFKHSNFDNPKVHHHWELNSAFNIAFHNHTKKINPGKALALSNYPKLVTEYSLPMFQYNVQGDIEQYVKDRMRVTNFVADCLEKTHKKFLFTDPD
ncbi:MAG: hypothetical protein PHY48_15775 [Candidatus Cloacimonetes bacterium]|nr:hypothetical protein [Candidatus Cloacimonadota bacterium]